MGLFETSRLPRPKRGLPGMIEVDRYLSAFTRRFGKSLRLRRGALYLARAYSRRYRRTSAPDVVIRDFDRNLKMRLDRTAAMGSLIYWTGTSARRLTRALKPLLKPEMVFADIGANQGELTLLAAKRLRRGSVLAFEPMPQAFQRLQANVEMNGFKNVHLHRCGLGDRSGEFEMFLDAHAESGAFKEEGWSSLHRSSRDDRSLGLVRIDRFDTVFEGTGLSRLDLVKIDVEGGELAVLRGARKVLQGLRPSLILEINEKKYRSAGYGTQDVVDLLADLGYRLFALGREDPRALDPSELPAFCDVLCRAT